MPRLRSSHPGEHAWFGVAPWTTSLRRQQQPHASDDAEPAAYTVVDMALPDRSLLLSDSMSTGVPLAVVPAAKGEPHHDSSPSTAQPQCPAQADTAAKRVLQTEAAQLTASLPPQRTDASEWVPRSKRQCLTGTSRSIPPAVVSAIQDPGLAASQPDVSPTQSGRLEFLDRPSSHGVATIALLPDGQISGHYLEGEGRTQRCVGLVGWEVASERECTRDAEWKLLRLMLHDFGSSATAELLVELTGGDALRLRAPLEGDSYACVPDFFELHGSEVESIAALQEDCDDSITLSFECDTILADSAAEEHLERYNPTLCGRQAVVNRGLMRIAGFVASAADKSRLDALAEELW